MRKILSILIALGLVLAFSVVAMPTAGAACTATLSISPATACAGATSTYTIGFTAPVTMQPGETITINFGTGTTFTSGATATVNTFAATIAKAAPALTVTIPTAAGTIYYGNAVTIVVTGVINPLAGTYTLTLDYDLNCCPAVLGFNCKAYTINPAKSSYGLTVDFGLTYPGIAEGFVPPFKACGQNASDPNNVSGFNTTYIDPYWYDQFYLILYETLQGCAPACANATLSFNVTSFPPVAGAEVSLNISGQSFTLNSTASSGTLVQNITLVVGSNNTFYSLLHFNKVGDYTICFDVTCPGNPAGDCTSVPPCAGATGPTSIIGGPVCYDFHAYQQKDAFKMTLGEKWNLISLPLVPLGDTGSIAIEDALESIPAADLAELVSIWNYDCATGDWLMYPGSGLTTFEDGKAYWMRFNYPLAACLNITWWVWGTAKPEPYNPPSQYSVCEGWNMVGYTELTSMFPSAYLWNWNGVFGQPNPVVYGYTQGCWTTQTWDLVGFASENMTPGQGYWVAFPVAGAIYVP